MTVTSVYNITFVLLLLIPNWAIAQIDASTVVTYRFVDDVPANGAYPVTVRWYADPVGDDILHSESQTIDVRDSVALIPLGRMQPIPDVVWLRGARYLGITFNGQTERQPRLVLTPVPLALAARRAEVAERLSPNVTGVVTSINEVAGNVWLVGEGGINVQRRGSVFTFTTGGADTLHQGTMVGNARTATYFLQLPAPLRHVHDLRVDVATADGSHVGVDIVAYDAARLSVELRCTAVLTPDDHIRWSYRP